MGENVCTSCHGSGTKWSGVEYYGQHEMVGCDECWGTGFDDVLAGVDGLRAEVARLTAERDALLDERSDWQSAFTVEQDAARSAELARLRAVIEEARKALSLNGNFYTPRAVVISILDRGLKDE